MPLTSLHTGLLRTPRLVGAFYFYDQRSKWGVGWVGFLFLALTTGRAESQFRPFKVETCILDGYMPIMNDDLSNLSVM